MRPEAIVQSQIVEYLRLKNIVVFETDVMAGLQFFSHNDPRRFAFINYHKKVGYLKGQPDLVVIDHGDILFVECKNDTGVLSKEQKQFKKDIESRGHRYFVWRSLDECVEYFK